MEGGERRAPGRLRPMEDSRTMKSIYFTEEHDAFRAQVRRFVETEVAPHGEAWEEAGRIPREIFRRMGELGFLGIMLPEAYGGTEGDVFFAIAFIEELPRAMLGGFCGAVTVQQFMATQHIYKFGSEALKQRYITPSVAGRAVGALGVTEPDTGSDVSAIRTRAVLTGDEYVVNGAKTYITNGADGDFYTLAVKTTPDAGVGGISLLAVDRDSPGITVTRRLKKLGLHCSDTAELSFEDVKVPASHLIGQADMGFYYLMEAFQLERLISAGISIGTCDVCLEKTLEYMKERKVFGKPLTKFQALTHRLAGLAAELEAARQLVYHAAWMLESGHQPVRECSMAKLACSELACRVVDACLQCHGGFGYMEEYPMARAFRDARSGTIVAGSSEVMREIIAKIMIEGTVPARVADRPASRRNEAPTPRLGTPAPPREATPAELLEELPIERTVEGLFQSLPRRLRHEAVEGWTARFHYLLAGASAPEWTVVIDDGACAVEPGLKGEPDCVVEMDEATYLGVETGQVNAQVAFMTGKVKVSNITAMMRYVKAFRPVK
jgi:alkylation response protein AidB-like acyl-CoA dehydrogenase/putative sterol carrier protein